MKKIKIEELVAGQLAITSARLVGEKLEKVELTFAEKIDRPGQAPNFVAFANQGDDRFNSNSGIRFAWQAFEPAVVESAFGIDCKKVTEEGVEINELVELEDNGYVPRIVLIDSVIPTEYDKKQGPQARAKNTGSATNPLYFIFNNKFVYGRSKVEFVAKGQEPRHQILHVKENGVDKPNCGLLPYDEALAMVTGNSTVNAAAKDKLVDALFSNKV